VSHLFLDASALVKRYAPEVGTAWVIAVTDIAAGNDILIAEITVAEVAAALAAKTRLPGGLTIGQRDHAFNGFLHDCQTRFLLVPTERHVIDRAADLTQRHPLRAYDAVQLASALIANSELIGHGAASLTFLAADQTLLMAARVEGLATDDPILHP
jgi:hypothetical protein